jgi:hypothetical protein
MAKGVSVGALIWASGFH